jgi:hypothetical protein
VLTNLAAVGVIAVCKPLAAVGLLKPSCGWRRTVGIGLKTPASKFALATFGLDSTLDVAGFLANEHCARLRVTDRRGCCVALAGVKSDSFLVREETLDPPKRFEPPAFYSDTFAGDELIGVVIRKSKDFIDVWMQFHHAAVDGAPMQELIGRLEARGARAPVVYPDHSDPGARPWHRPGQRPTHHLSGFLDFSPLLAARKAMASPTPPVGAMLVWRLARQPGFETKKFAATVDVPATAREPRCVDFVITRPSDFANFNDFATDYSRQIEACRRRQSPTYKAMRTMALLPPRLALRALRLNADRTRETFGTVGLTILKGAKVFLAPMSDPGFDDGFVAIGDMGLPSATGGRVGSVSIKGDQEKPEALWQALRGTLQAPANAAG